MSSDVSATSGKFPSHIPKPSIDSVQVHLLGTEGLLFCRERKQLFYLNATAAFIWCALLEGIEPGIIAEAISTQFNIPLDRAHRDIHETLSNWATTGLPATTSSDPARQHAMSSSSAPAPSPLITAVSGETFICAVSHLYCLGTQLFQIRYGAESAAACVHPALAQLKTDAPTATSDSPTLIDVVCSGGLYQLRLHGKVQAEGLMEEELTPLINRIMLHTVFESSDCLAAFHAGAIGDSRGCVLLPGAPGSGKSTLVAALVNAGYRYLTDELALLLPDNTLCPLPISAGLKRGAWPLFPAHLANQPVHRQADGTEVSYLPTFASLQPCPPLKALVFPRYIAGVNTQLTPLSNARALYEISAAGYAVRKELDSELVSQLVAWIAPIRCYQLQVGEINSAVLTIRKLLA